MSSSRQKSAKEFLFVIKQHDATRPSEKHVCCLEITCRLVFFQDKIRRDCQLVFDTSYSCQNFFVVVMLIEI